MARPGRIAALAALACAALAACVPPSPQPTPAPSPAPAPIPTPSAVAAPAPPAQPPALQLVTPGMDDWITRPSTPGDWFYTAEPAETIASFGASRAAEDTLLVMVCRLPQRRIGIGYVGQAAGQVEMFIRTETADRTLTAGPATGRTPLVLAELPASDPLLDAMALSKGRFVVEVAGQPPLFLPAWPEITRVIEDCRD